MVDISSEEHIKKYCPFDDSNNIAFTYLLEETADFKIVCDYNPLKEGHILIIPKEHIPSIGEYPDQLFNNFLKVYQKVSKFILSNYGSLSTFEHGKIGQTVFHSHVHLLPFNGNSIDIIPEGKDYIEEIKNLDDLRGKKEYLFFSINDKKWIVNTEIGVPRFFRDRFANAIGEPERGNWKIVQNDLNLRKKFDTESIKCKNLWIKWDARN